MITNLIFDTIFLSIFQFSQITQRSDGLFETGAVIQDLKFITKTQTQPECNMNMQLLRHECHEKYMNGR